MGSREFWTITKIFTFDAAHRLPHHEGACKNLHGHTYRVEVHCGSESLCKSGSASGMVVDFGCIKDAWEEAVHVNMDHSDLNDLMENPTAELIAQWIWRALEPQLPLTSIAVWETPTSRCSYTER